MKIIKLYKKEKDKEKKEWFLYSVIIFLGSFFCSLFPIIYESNDRLYLKANIVQFIMIIIVFSLFLISKEKSKEIYRHWKEFIFRKDKLFTVYEYGDVFLFNTFLLASFSMIFILDLDFINNYGIKIGTVVAINLIYILRNIVSTRRKNK